MGIRIGERFNKWFQKAEQTVEKKAREVGTTLQKKLDSFEANPLVKQGKEFVQATVDSFEQAVHHQNPADPPVMRDERGTTTWQAPANQQLVVDGIKPEDVKQGGAGDCYFLSTLASVADTHPELLQKAIRTNADGTYTVTFHVPPGFEGLKALGPAGGLLEGGILGAAGRLGLGTPARTVEVTVDADFATRADGSSAYARPNGNELWARVMEKAYAKLWGGYGAIGNGGAPATAMFALTGQPAAHYSNGLGGNVGVKVRPTNPSAAEQAEIFARLKAATEGGQLVVANTYSNDSFQAMPGIVNGHSYTVLGTAERDGQRFVQLRNPWGHAEPGKDGRDDGVFELTVEQFAQQYASYDIGRV